MNCVFSLFFFLSFFSFVLCENDDAGIKEADTAWIIVASAMVMIMTPGLAFFYGGLVRQKSFVSILGQCLIIYSLVTGVWAFIGYSLSFGDSKSEFLGGVQNFALRNVDYNSNEYAPTIPSLLFYFYQNKFAAITPCLFIGAMAERVRFVSIVILSALWIIVVYCPIAHWNWNTNGFLKTLGVLDFAGGNVIHLSSGTAALLSAMFTDYACGKKKMLKNLKAIASRNNGPRRSMEMGSSRKLPKHGRQVQEEGSEANAKESTAFVVLGTSLLWFGWFGFNGGSALGATSQSILALINSNIAASSALLTWYVLETLSGKKASVIGMCIGAVCGLVGITPACGFVPIYASGIIGSLASLGTYLFYKTVENCRYKPDDRLGVFGCHGISGIIGSILIGFFADKNTGATRDGIFLGGGGELLGIQLAGICCSFIWSFFLTFILIFLMYICGLFRVIDEDDETEVSDFDEQAVFMPDIKKIFDKYKKESFQELQALESKKERLNSEGNGNEDKRADRGLIFVDEISENKL